MARRVTVQVGRGPSQNGRFAVLLQENVIRTNTIADLYPLLRATGAHDSEVLHYKDNAIDEDSTLTFRELVGDTVDMMCLTLVKTAQNTSTTIFQLPQNMHEKSIEELDSMTNEGQRILRRLLRALRKQTAKEPEAEQWLHSIKDMLAKAGNTKTIIRVVGATGIGKSSMINALLDEQQLMPTSSVQACTAVITEISYHDSSTYSAEVEYVERADWENELAKLVQEQIEGSGNSRSSETDVSWAKIKSVYPNVTKESIKNISVAELMTFPGVSTVLGKTKTIEDTDAKGFLAKLQDLIDPSKNGTTHNVKAYWPLIKIVRIRCSHPILENGLILVDLPGTQDSNLARENVCQEFMTKCTGLFIIAEMKRAVSDKTAKTLMGNTFRRQLKLDGGFINNMVTFVCTKTDDILTQEVENELHLEGSLNPLYEQKESNKAELEKVLGRLKEARETQKAQAKETEDLWTRFKSEVGSSKTNKNKQRQHDDEGEPAAKRRKESPSENAHDTLPADDQPQDPVAAMKRLTDLTDEINARDEDRNIIDEQIENLKDQIKKLKEKIIAQEQQILSKVIQARNEYSRAAIKQDFAAGIREIDEEVAQETNADTFDPTAMARDYDAIAKNLNVFCISSRAYQKLEGLNTDSTVVQGFANIENTEIPQLQEHCKTLTLKGRRAACERFLTTLTHLLNSLVLWLSGENSKMLHAIDEQQLIQFRDQIIEKLGDDLAQAVAHTCANTRFVLVQQLKRSLRLGAGEARLSAPGLIDRWGQQRWNVYKAHCRHNGVWNGLDWNASLAEPFMRTIAGPWEDRFSHEVQVPLRDGAEASARILQDFHHNFVNQLTDAGAELTFAPILDVQLAVTKRQVDFDATLMIDHVRMKQREINRDFVPAVLDAMLPGYEHCCEESGGGMFARMKAHMKAHVDRNKNSMFVSGMREVVGQLNNLNDEVRNIATNNTTRILESFKRDYSRPLIIAPKIDHALRERVEDIIDDADVMFHGKVIKREVVDEDSVRVKQEQVDEPAWFFDDGETLFLD